MSRKYAIAIMLLLGGCAGEPVDHWPMPPDPSRAMRAAAESACHGKVVEVASTSETSTYPFIVKRDFWYRCESDGRRVGPFGYVEEW